jgi:hypothetical protein
MNVLLYRKIYWLLFYPKPRENCRRSGRRETRVQPLYWRKWTNKNGGKDEKRRCFATFAAGTREQAAAMADNDFSAERWETGAEMEITGFQQNEGK